MHDLEELIQYYKKQGAPADQTALVSLLKDVQQESGGTISQQFLPPMAQTLGVKESYLLALIKRLPSLRLADTHCLEVCAGANCGKRASLAAFAQKICDKEKITVKEVPCMRMCGKGPNIKWDGQLYHQADEALIRRLIRES